MTSDSVISSLSVPRASAVRPSTPRRSWMRSWRSNCRDETLNWAKPARPPATAARPRPSARGLAGAVGSLPLRELLGGVVEDEKAQIHDQSDLLGDRYEFHR